MLIIARLMNMDVNDLRNFFYVVASIALILLSITIIAIFYLIIRLKKKADEIADQSKNLMRTWERLSIARMFFRLVKLIF